MVNNDIDQLKSLCQKSFGCDKIEIDRLAGAGSSRRYYRITVNGISMVGVVGTNKSENEAFIYLSRHFASRQLPVPDILAVSSDLMCYIISDLGSTSLFDCLENSALVEKTIRQLPALQFDGAVNLDFFKCFPVDRMDTRSIMWDLNYFKYCFLKPTGIDFDEVALEDDFISLSKSLIENTDKSTWGFMYRDFQSRNVMVLDDQPYFIDYQGGRYGPCHYDLVSFLWQARAAFSDEFKASMIDAYLDSLQAYVKIDRNRFKLTLRHYVLFRLLQVLGAYGLRGLIQNKPHFVLSIVPAMKSLGHELETGVADDYPELCRTLKALVSLDIFQDNPLHGLTIHVNSFGFRKSGIPRDMSGNGGGYVFDCRSLPNPGRLDEFKSQTGRDKEVADYLNRFEEVDKFFYHAEEMVSSAVKRYIERGFSDLTVSFGCTGGQHRSVYMAERLASSIAKCFHVNVIVNHIEQNIKETVS